MSEWFDSHCHLENERFADNLPDVLSRMADAQVRKCILAGSDRDTSRKIVQLAAEIPGVYGAVGFHPHEARTWQSSDPALLEAWLKEERIVAIGEIGLDYYYDHSPRDMQQAVFEEQLRFAYEHHAPTIFHVRDAHGDMIDILRAQSGKLPAGVLHCYSGSVESAKIYLDMGFYLSFAGPVTFKNAKQLVDVAAYCPADRLLVETDSPYLAPEPMRGKRNEPAFVRFVGQRVAEIRGVAPEELMALATENTCRLFGIA